jgi:hypothetical protein
VRSSGSSHSWTAESSSTVRFIAVKGLLDGGSGFQNDVSNAEAEGA